MAGECRAEFCDCAVGRDNRRDSDGWVELTDEPTLGVGVGLDVQSWRENEVRGVLTCGIDLILRCKGTGSAEAGERCGSGCRF